MNRSPSPAPGWHRPAEPRPVGGQAGFDWADLYQRTMQVVSYAVYAGVLLLMVGLFTWPRPEPTGERETHRERAQRLNLSLAYKRRGNISEPCRLLLANFADAFADFMSCTVKASRPLAVCTRCAQNRYPLELAYRHILAGTGPEDAHCRLELLDLTGEIANIFSGNAREKLGSRFEISPPVISRGKLVNMRVAGGLQTYCIPIIWLDRKANLIVAVD